MELNVDLPGRAYPVIIGGSAIPRAGGFLTGAAAVVTDENVYNLYGAYLEDVLRSQGRDFFTVIVPPGEKSKSADTLGRLYSAFHQNGLTRNGRVVAFGGGVVGDLAGFAASTYMRGVPFVQIPTTLLAQVDASVGGKVAVNLDAGKNLAGSFYQPLAVLADTFLLSTLPDREWLTGMAEVVKHALIGGGELAELLASRPPRRPAERGDTPELDRLICLNCKHKASVVLNDEFDTSARMTLNFGHTFGHALEVMGGYEKYTHGEAVAAGMAIAARAGTLLGVSEPGTEKAVLNLMDSCGLNYELHENLSDVIHLMSGDKKNANTGELTLILLKKIGKPVIYQVTPEKLAQAFGTENSAPEIRRSNRKLVSAYPGGLTRLPPSKSIAHRAVICGALAGGGSRIENVSFSQDIEATLRCINGLGYPAKRLENGDISSESMQCRGGSHIACRGARIDCGESGTTLRFMIPLAALRETETVFTGQGRLMSRPLTPLMDALSKQGASLRLDGDLLTVRGPLRPGRFTLPGDVSSQYVSGLLLALPLCGGDSVIEMESPLQSASYVDMTVDVMRRFGVTVQNQDYRRFTVEGGQRYRPDHLIVEGDYSQAAFFLVAGALGRRPCGCIWLNPDSKQGDRKIVEILERSGVKIERGVYLDTPGVKAYPGRIAPQVVDMGDIPDLAPPIAALFAFADGESRLVNAKRLRHKESDRLDSIASALAALGARAQARGDELIINGVERIRGGTVDSRGDHRIAMMGAVASVRSDGPVRIEQSDCVAKSYPDFWKDFCKTVTV